MVACLVLAFSVADKANAENLVIPFAMDDAIAGIKIALPATLTISKNNSNEPLGLTARVDLSDLFTNANAIVNSLGAARLVEKGVTVQHTGTILSIGDGMLHSKIHLKLNWKSKILGIRSSVTTNGSVTLHGTLVIVDNRLGLSVIVDKPAISNDAVRAAADFFDGQELTQQLMQQFLDQKLGDPKAQFPLPLAVQASGVTLTSARFQMDDKTPTAVLEGTVSNAALKWLFN